MIGPERTELVRGEAAAFGLVCGLVAFLTPGVALADMGVSLFDGLWMSALVLALVTFLEALIVARGLQLDYFKGAAVAAWVNLLSAGLGFGVLYLERLTLRLPLGAIVLAFFFLTVGVEWVALRLAFRRLPARRIWVVAVGMNVVSYIFVAGALFSMHPDSFGIRSSPVSASATAAQAP